MVSTYALVRSCNDSRDTHVLSPSGEKNARDEWLVAFWVHSVGKYICYERCKSIVPQECRCVLGLNTEKSAASSRARVQGI